MELLEISVLAIAVVCAFVVKTPEQAWQLALAIIWFVMILTIAGEAVWVLGSFLRPLLVG